MRRQVIFSLVIFTSVFLGYIATLYVGFYSDDYAFTPMYILPAKQIWIALQNAHMGLLNIHPFRPTVFFSFLIDYKIYGFEPVGFHLTNLLIHSINAVLVFFLTKKLSENDWTAFIAALFFGLYPGHIETIAWVSGRFDLLAGTWFLSSVLLWLHATGTKFEKYLLPVSGFMFFLSLFSKEVAIAGILVFPVLIVMYGKGTEKSKWMCLVHQIVAVIAFLAIRYWLFGNIEGDTFSTRGGLTERLAPDFIWPNLWEDLRLLMTPFNRTSNSTNELFFYISYGILLAASLINIFVARVRSNYFLLVTALIWTLGFILPSLVMGEVKETLDNARFLYLPVMGMAMLIGMSVFKNSRLVNTVLAIVIIFALGLNYFTIQNNARPWIETSEMALLIDTCVVYEVTSTSGPVTDDLILILVNVPDIVNGVHLSPNQYKSYLDYVAGIQIKGVNYTRIEPHLIPDWYERLQSQDKPYRVFVFDEETGDFSPL